MKPEAILESNQLIADAIDGAEEIPDPLSRCARSWIFSPVTSRDSRGASRGRTRSFRTLSSAWLRRSSTAVASNPGAINVS